MKPEFIAFGIYLVKVPFEDIYTSVFIITQNGKAAIIDSATTAFDVDNYVIPAIAELGIKKEDVQYLLLTHNHGDHSGGAVRVKQYFENVRICAFEPIKSLDNEIIDEDSVILDRIRLIHLPGHTKTSVAYLDTLTKTLLSGDCLQLRGVSRFVYGVKYKDLYISSMEKLLKMDDVELLVASHEYDPLGAFARGRDEIEKYVKACIDYA